MPNQIDSDTKFDLRQWGALATLFVGLQGVLYLLGVVVPCERFHIALPVVWVVNRLTFARVHKPIRLPSVVCGLIITGALALAFSSIAATNASAYGEQSSWKEVVARLVLVASLCVIYGLVSQLITVCFELVPRAKRLVDIPGGWWLRGLRGLLSLLLIGPYVFVVLNVHRVKVTDSHTPFSNYKLHFEAVTIPTSDGMELAGWYIPSPGSRKGVVVCHGVGANKNIFIGVAPFLHRAGFNVLLFDFRGHGESSGHTVSFGYYEARDVEAAATYLRQKRGCSGIVGYGFSMGGAALLNAIPNIPELRGVIVDSTFARFRPLVAAQVTFLPPPLDRMALRLSSFYSRLELGTDIAAIEPRRYIGALSPRPVLIIHGLADKLIPTVQAESNYAAAKQPKELWLVPRAGHCYCRLVNIPVYEKRVTEFLKRCIPIVRRTGRQ